MNISKKAIENYQFTIIIIALFLISGIVSLVKMPRSEDPLISPAGSSVIVIYPGANPEDMEELFVDPIEEVINELEDIKEIKSTAEDGLAIIAVEFLAGSDPDDKYSDVLQKFNSIKNDLPAGILSLDITKWSITDVNILQLALISASDSYRSLEKEAEQIKEELEKIPGIKKSNVLGYPEQEIRISLNLEKLVKNRLSLNLVLGAIQNENQNIPGGNVDVGSKRYNIQTSGSYDSIEDIKNTILYTSNGKIVYLKQVADISYGYEDQNYYTLFNSQRALFITANQKEGTNIFDIDKQIKEKINEFKTKLPPTMDLQIAFDQSVSVEKRVKTFFSNLLQGLILVGMVVFMVIGWRASIIIMMVIPISILIALGFVDFSGYGIQQMTIAGMVIALGLLVDNAIVVTENISRFLKNGKDKKEAAVEGTRQISWAIISSTLTTVLAFIPMMMIGDLTGDFIRSLPISVVYTLMASLFISLTLTPYLASKFLKVRRNIQEKKIRQILNTFIETRYRSWLNTVLNKPLVFLMLAILIFLISLSLIPVIGFSLFPKAEKPQLIININTPDGTNIKKTFEIAQYVESELKQYKEVKHYTSNIGRGNPRIYYNVVPEREKSTHAQIIVELKEYSLELFSNTIYSMREKFSKIPGVEIEVKEFEQGPPVEAPIAIRLIGDNLSILNKIAKDVEKIVALNPGTVNVKNPVGTPKTDLHIQINRAKAATYGVPISEIDKTIRASITGLPISQFRDPEGKEYNIVVRLPIVDRPRIEDFDKIYITSLRQAQIPLKQLASISFKASPILINHYNLSRNVTITSDVIGQESVDKITKQIIKKLDQYNWPKGYRYSIGGELESRTESFGGMFQAVIIAMLAIFAVLVLQFRSFSQPVIVFSAIPLAVVGSIIALLITGFTFSFTAFIGITSLVGIVVNNSIILVDYINQLRAKGKTIINAIKEAGETRFIPIALTTATTIGGLLPLTLSGGSLWAPMGWTIIGGLIVSTMLTLLIVPALYRLFTSKIAAN